MDASESTSIHLGVPVLAIDDGYNSRLFGDCPYVKFVTKEYLSVITWTEIECVIAQRGIKYASPHIRSWNDRMREEVAWVESLCEPNDFLT